MSQHDFNIANQSFPATRTDLNNALQALASNSSGDAEPSTTFANQWWYETDTNTLKLRNEANNAWLSFATVDQSTAAWTLAHDVTVSNGLTVSGAFTSLGIDDNATSNAITIDSSENVGIGMTPVASYGLLQVGSAVTSALGVGGLQAYVAGTNSALGQNGNMSIVTTDGQAANIGGSIGLGGKFVAAGTSVLFAQISGRKENGTDNNSAGYLQFATQPNGGTPLERMRIDSSGNVGIGTSSPATKLEVASPAATTAVLRISSNKTGTGSGDKSRLEFYSADNSGTAYDMGYMVYDRADGTGTASYIAWASRVAGTVAERMRISSSGDLLVGTTNNTPVQSNITGGLSYRPSANLEVQGNATNAALFGRTDDGRVIDIYSAGTREGDISVSGTTVSYNGGHLARWSQLADNTRDDTLLKGTVLTNLDQMASWFVGAVEATYYTEDDELPDGVSVGDEKTPAVAEHYQENEQLNCMAISSVEGDPNVAGVFVNWDNDDDIYTNDMNIAMTGDMIIRIAEGTTVARGDLLMSAGDGTAKPQGDDIVRGKTIAKVTSTHITCTYDDGSYCVPCVLMAC